MVGPVRLFTRERSGIAPALDVGRYCPCTNRSYIGHLFEASPARGRKLAEILADLGHVAEGVGSAREVSRIAAARGVEMPVTDAVNAVLEGGLAPAKAVELLLSRDPKKER